MKNNSQYKYFLGNYFLDSIVFFVILVVISIVYNSIVAEEYGDRAIEIAHTVGKMLDEEHIENYSSIKTGDSQYIQIINLLDKIGSNFDGLNSIHLIIPFEDDKAKVVAEMFYLPSQAGGYVSESAQGELYTFEELGFSHINEIVQADIDYTIYEKKSGINRDLLTGYASITNEDGRVTAIVAVSFSLKIIKEKIIYYTASLGGFILFVGIVVDIIKYMYAKRLVIEPTERIISNIDEYLCSQNNDNGNPLLLNENFARDDNLEQIVNELIDYAKVSTENRAELKEDLDKYHLEETMLGIIQTDMLLRTLTKNYEDKYIHADGNAYYIRDFSGFFYDFYKMTNGKYSIVSASVMDRKSVSALCMAFVKMIIKDEAFTDHTPDEKLDIANNKLVAGNDMALFTRIFLAEYDANKHKLYYSSASGIVPFIIRDEKNVISLKQEKDYMPLGAWEDTPYELSEIETKPGDILVMYSRPADYDNRLIAEFNEEKLANVVIEEKNKAGSIIDNTIGRIKNSIQRENFEYSLLIVTLK